MGQNEDIEMELRNKYEENIKDIKYLRKFKVLAKVLFDADNDGSISISEFSNVFCKKMGYDMAISKKVWQFIDKNKTGSICLTDAAEIFGDDNPHFEIDFFIDKMYKFLKELQKKHDKKEQIDKQRDDKIDQQIMDFENE